MTDRQTERMTDRGGVVYSSSLIGNSLPPRKFAAINPLSGDFYFLDCAHRESAVRVRVAASR